MAHSVPRPENASQSGRAVAGELSNGRGVTFPVKSTGRSPRSKWQSKSPLKLVLIAVSAGRTWRGNRHVREPPRDCMKQKAADAAQPLSVTEKALGLERGLSASRPIDRKQVAHPAEHHKSQPRHLECEPHPVANPPFSLARQLPSGTTGRL
jgi:hypothetical protein